MTNSSESMREFIQRIAEESLKGRSAGKIAAAAIGKTILMNLISVPFGFISASIPRIKTCGQIVSEIEGVLYGPFKVGFFTDPQKRARTEEKKDAFTKYLDGLSIDQKSIIVSAVLNSPGKYSEPLRRWVDDPGIQPTRGADNESASCGNPELDKLMAEYRERQKAG